MLELLLRLAVIYLPNSVLRKWFALKSNEVDSSIHGDNQLLIDVSVISNVDAQSGIQRVVRNLYKELLVVPPAGYYVCPVAATRSQGYRYLPIDFLEQLPEKLVRSPETLVQVRRGDIFLGLDLAANIVPYRMVELLRWKRRGVRLCFFVYDLLPVRNPAWFNPKTTQHFLRWLRALAVLADEVISISQAVRADFTALMQHTYGLGEGDIPCTVIQLGAEMSAIASSPTLRSSRLPQHLARNKFVLIVGTIEPRKGHADVLDAFEAVWSAGDQTNLVIAGKQGWKMAPFISRLKAHSEAGKRLHWLNGPSDHMLGELYQHCGGLVMASKGEGLGLPILEAAYFNKPLLVRDIPVFKEFAGNAACYFSNVGGNGLAQALPGWLEKLESRKLEISKFKIYTTWKESCAQLVRALMPASVDSSNPEQQLVRARLHPELHCTSNVE